MVSKGAQTNDRMNGLEANLLLMQTVCFTMKYSKAVDKQMFYMLYYTLLSQQSPQLNIRNETQAAAERDCGCAAPVAESASGAEKADIEGF